MNAKHAKTLALIFSRPVSGNVRWRDAEALLSALGAELVEAAGSRVRVFLFNEVRVFHRPHPSPDMNKAAVAGLRGWLENNGVTP